MYGLAVYKKEGIPFERDLSLQNSQDSYYILYWFCFIHFYFFSLIDYILALSARFLVLFHLK